MIINSIDEDENIDRYNLQVELNHIRLSFHTNQ